MAAAAAWPEVQDCVDKKKHELRLSGATLKKRLDELSPDPSRLPESFVDSLGPLLTFLELAGCPSLTRLPDSFSRMTQLHELLLVNNGLTELPPGIRELPLLRTLIVEGNQLTQLPGSIFSCPRLHTLNASRNKLVALPDALLAAKELHVLNVGFNQLQELPAVLVKLPKLSTLIASHNNIAQLPPGISRLALLADLQMTHCQLKAVPQELAAAPKLKTLLLEPNPWEDKKLSKVLKEGRLKNILTHIKKHGAPPSAAEEVAAAAALARLQLAAAAAKPYQLEAVDKAAQLDVYVHPEVKGVRPFLVCAVLRGVVFSQQLYDAFIALQTSLHESPLCNKRESAAIGTHSLARLTLPLQYQAQPPEEVRFVPLSRDKDAAAAAAGGAGGDGEAQPAAGSSAGREVSVEELAKHFAGDKTMLRYLSLIQDKPSKAAPLVCVLRDASQAVLSVSPVINADFCRVVPDSPEPQDVLVEVSSPDSLEVAQKVCGEFIEQFAAAYKAATGQLLRVAPVRMLTHGTGHVRLVFPK